MSEWFTNWRNTCLLLALFLDILIFLGWCAGHVALTLARDGALK